MKRVSLHLARYAILACWLGRLALCPAVAQGAEEALECRIVYQTPDGLFVDVGSELGVKVGSRGAVLRGGSPIARVEVIRVSRSSSLLRVLSGPGESVAELGDTVSIDVEKSLDDATTQAPPPRLEEHGQDSEDFVPLLAPEGGAEPVRSEPSNIFHGELSLRQLFQVDPATGLDYSVTRFGFRGSADRLGGTPWALEWSGDLSYRDGEALGASPDYRQLRLRMHRLAASRRFDDGSRVRLGRFLPQELPSVGYVDGVQVEKVLEPRLRLGAVAGFKPSRGSLDVSIREPMVAPYVTVELGERSRAHYSGTAGVLGSLYNGDPDRLSILVDQRLSLGRRLSFYATSELDFGINSETRDGLRLTHLDVYGNYDLAEFLSLRAGLDHYERPDTEAERDSLPYEDSRFFDEGYWRYWVGCTGRLPWSLTLYGELGYIDSAAGEPSVHWHGSITRVGLPLLPAASLSLSIYNFDGNAVVGYGGQLSSGIPLVADRLFLDAGVTFRFLESDPTPASFRFSDVFGRVTWNVSRSWALSSGASYSLGTDVDRYLFDLGVSFRW